MRTADVFHAPAVPYNTPIRGRLSTPFTVLFLGTRNTLPARQVWLAYPGELNSNNSIVVDDEYYVFLAEKGPCYQDDQTPCGPEEIFGGDIIVHPTAETDSDKKNNSPLIPENILMTFAKGILAYFQTICAE